MPPRTKAAAAPAVETEDDELEFAYVVDKEPTAVQTLCTEWMSERTGYDLDEKTVQIVLSLYGKFQRSDENQADIAERKRAAAENKAAREKRLAEREEKAKDAPVKRTRASKDDDDETPAPRRGRRPAAKTAAAEPAAPPTRSTSRRRPAAKAPAQDLD